MANLPGDVVEDILSRLPVESLLRFKCVCKSWYAIIRNPKFVSRHMTHQSKGNVILLKYYPEIGIVFSFPSNFGDICRDFFCIEDLKMPKTLEYVWLHMIGHCNGLVAFSDSSRDIILCNPAIREFRILPESCLLPRPQCKSGYNYEYPESSVCLHAETSGMGFGYDAKTDDYKVVRIVGFWERYSSTKLPTKVEVFSLRGNSTWREVNNSVVDVEFCYGDGKDQFFDGVHYWKAKDLNSFKPVLVSFDMADEVFWKASLPDCCYNDYTSLHSEYKETNLGVFNDESLALFIRPLERSEGCIDVWVMKEFGLKESWTKQLTIGPLRLGRPFVFWKNDEELLLEGGSGLMTSYNLATLKSKELPILGAGQQRWRVATYKKTLVSVNAREDTAAR